MEVTVDLSDRMNINLVVDHYSHEVPIGGHEELGYCAGEVEISHPSYVEHFQLFVHDPEITHTWYRVEDNQYTKATITETLLLWSIFNKEEA